MIWMGLDMGERRIGVALSDAAEIIAQPHCTLEVGTAGELPVEEIRKVLNRHRVEGLVLGLPKRLDGSLGPEANQVKRSARRLEVELKIEVVLWDERLSSVEANRRLVEAGVRRQRRKGITDRIAAALVLQSFLDHRSLGDQSGQQGS
ncbi:MAG: Holliday junction resolvase RuvX [Acidobacteriota bacterium]